MIHRTCYRKALVATLCVALLLLQPMLFHGSASAVAASPDRLGSVADVRLDRDGILRGAVVDARGIGVDRSTVALLQGADCVAIATTGSDGLFRIADVRGGVYLLATGDHYKRFRLWTHGTAPDSALSSALLISESQVVRGQQASIRRCRYPGRVLPIRYNLYEWMAERPLVAYGLLTAAIAVPIAVIAHQDDSKNPLRPLIPAS